MCVNWASNKERNHISCSFTLSHHIHQLCLCICVAQYPIQYLNGLYWPTTTRMALTPTLEEDKKRTWKKSDQTLRGNSKKRDSPLSSMCVSSSRTFQMWDTVTFKVDPKKCILLLCHFTKKHILVWPSLQNDVCAEFDIRRVFTSVCWRRKVSLWVTLKLN